MQQIAAAVRANSFQLFCVSDHLFYQWVLNGFCYRVQTSPLHCCRLGLTSHEHIMVARLSVNYLYPIRNTSNKKWWPSNFSIYFKKKSRLSICSPFSASVLHAVVLSFILCVFRFVYIIALNSHHPDAILSLYRILSIFFLRTLPFCVLNISANKHMHSQNTNTDRG